MLKRLHILVVTIGMVLTMLMTGCNGTQEKDNNASVQEEQETPEVLTGTIIKTTDSSILVLKDQTEDDKDQTEAFADLYYVGLKDAKVSDIDGNKSTAAKLETGMRVNIAYDGVVKETYPAGITADTIEIIEQTGDLIGMYLKVIMELYSIDPGLNSDIQTIALDLTKVCNLSEGQKSALKYLMTCEYDEEIRLTTIEELKDEGKIKDFYYEDGIVFIISDNLEEDDTFKFAIQKWRSFIGGIGFSNCKATKKNDVWEYETGEGWIS